MQVYVLVISPVDENERLLENGVEAFSSLEAAYSSAGKLAADREGFGFRHLDLRWEDCPMQEFSTQSQYQGLLYQVYRVEVK